MKKNKEAQITQEQFDELLKLALEPEEIAKIMLGEGDIVYASSPIEVKIFISLFCMILTALNRISMVRLTIGNHSTILKLLSDILKKQSKGEYDE